LREPRRRAGRDPNLDVAECLTARIDAELRRCSATEGVIHRSDHVDVLLDLRIAISEASMLHALERGCSVPEVRGRDRTATVGARLGSEGRG
jgi:hypothetical protein